MRAPILCLARAACASTPTEVADRQQRAATDRQALDRALAGKVAGKPISCLADTDRRNARTSFIGSTILYTVGRDRVFRNDMLGGCNLRGDPILINSTPSTFLCRGDIVQLIDRTSRFPVGSCAYSDFVPYERAR